MAAVMGSDPGKSGAIVVLSDDGAVDFIKLDETEADICQWLEEVIQEHGGIREARLERVSSSPQMGVVSAFKFGRSYGQCRTLLHAYGIRFEDVTPQTWQRSMRCLTKGDKNVTKAKAQELFPGQKITHAIADALLRAEYCRRETSQGAVA